MKTRTFKNRILSGVALHFKTLLCATLLITSTQSVTSHGTVTSPPSRVWICFQEGPENLVSPACIAARIGYGTQAFYDWSEVARMDAAGDHRAILGPGNLASAGRPDKYGGLDQVRNDWVATPVSAGPFTVTWTNQAPHKTLYYDVYITKASWTPDQPLTWDVLELLTRTSPRDAAVTDNIPVTLPARTGKHVIFSVWQRSLTPEAFYSTSDVDFGSGSGSPIDVPNNTPPVADIKIASVSGRTVTFDTSGSTDANGDALTYRFNYGDGTQDQGVGGSPTHSYNNARSSYSVIVTVSDEAGLSDTAKVVVDFSTNGNPPPSNTAPVANIAVTPGTTGTAPFTVNFDASGSTDVDGDTLSYDIIYGNGNMGTNLNVNSPYTYTEAGTFTATLTVRDGNGGVNTASVTITVNPSVVDPPIVNGFIYSENTQPDLSDDANAPSGPFALLSGANSIEATQSGTPRDIDYFTITIPAGYELSKLLVSEFSDTTNIGFIGVTEGNTSAPQTGVGLLGGTLYGGTIGADLLGTPAGPGGPGFSDSISAGNYTVWLNQTSGTTTTRLTFEVTEVVVVNPPIIVNAGTITGGPFTFTVGDGIADNVSGVSVSGNTGETSQWVVTDSSRNILGLPPTPETVNFDTAGVGSCFIYSISYNGTLTGLTAGTNLDALSGDFQISNSIEVVRNAVVVTPPNGDLCNFGTPSASPLPTTYAYYTNAYVLGVNGPNLSNVNGFSISWDLANNGLWNIAIQTSDGVPSYYISLVGNVTHNLAAANPSITFSNVAIPGFDGEYYAAIVGSDLVLASKNSEFAIYLSNSATAPNCTGAKNINDVLFSARIFPNPATTSISIQNETDLQGSLITISDLAGKEVKSVSIKDNTTIETIDISSISAGFYLLKITDNSGSSRILKLVVN